MRDSYQTFFEHFKIDFSDIIEFGIEIVPYQQNKTLKVLNFKGLSPKFAVCTGLRKILNLLIINIINLIFYCVSIY